MADVVKDTSRIARSCVPLDRSPAALALVLGLMVVIAVVVKATAAEPVVAARQDCETISLGADTTATTAGPVALADITICYRPLPLDAEAPDAAVIEAATADTPARDPGRI